MPIRKWIKRKDGVDVLMQGRNKVLEIHKKDKRYYNGEYTFYKCLVFKNGEIVAAEGLFGSSLRYKYLAVRWGCKKARELEIITP